MPRRPDTLETVHLTIELLSRIPSLPRKVDASTLHRQLQDAGIQRDLRTIQRQLKMITEHFDVICDDRSKPYGYSWKEKARGISLPGLNEQQSLLLSLAEQHLRNLLPTPLLRSMESFFSQARANLTLPDRGHREREWLKKVRVVSTSQPLLPPAIDDRVFEAVSNTLYANLLLEIRYRNRSGKEIEATVMPLGLAQQGEILYLVCRFQGYDNERSLALHRFESARATTMTFKRPPDFHLSQYDNDGRFGYGEGHRVRLTFEIRHEAGLHLLESRLSEDQQVQEIDGGYRITATVVDSGQLEWWLRSFGDNVCNVTRKPLS